MQPKPECDARRMLHSRYLTDFRVYVDALHRLENNAEPETFEHLSRNLKRAKRVFEAARDRLRKHCAEHKCEMPEGVL